MTRLMMTELTKGLLGSNVTATKYGRDLVWNEEFNGNSVNTEYFKYPYDSDDIRHDRFRPCYPLFGIRT